MGSVRSMFSLYDDEREDRSLVPEGKIARMRLGGGDDSVVSARRAHTTGVRAVMTGGLVDRRVIGSLVMKCQMVAPRAMDIGGGFESGSWCRCRSEDSDCVLCR